MLIQSHTRICPRIHFNRSPPPFSRQWICLRTASFRSGLFSAMPRPKVKPQDRQRSARACDACKASKKRCDANQPCRLCVKKGTQDTCTFTPTPRDRRSRHARSASHATSLTTAAGNVSTGHIPTHPQTQSVPRPNGPLGPQVSASDEDIDSESDDLEDSRDGIGKRAQRPVMLDNSNGDKGTPFLGFPLSLYLGHTYHHLFVMLTLCLFSLCWQHSSPLFPPIFTKNVETLRWTLRIHRS